MIIKTEQLKEIAKKIVPAVDPNNMYPWTEAIELSTEGDILHLVVASNDYYIDIRIEVGQQEKFHTAVNAAMFLNLISQMTSDTIELAAGKTFLEIKGNGSYKLPLIFDKDQLITIPKIIINNVTCEMEIDTSILQSITKYNSKELSKGYIMKPIQKMYYVDECGAITFTTGACVNQFTLDKPVRMLLSNRIVQLFKLFNQEKVKFAFGHDQLPHSSIIQTKAMFADDTITLTCILSCDDTLLRSVPVANIRGRAEEVYPYSAVISKVALIQAIDRMTLICSRGVKTTGVPIIGKFIFKDSAVALADQNEANSEDITYTGQSIPQLAETPFVAGFNLKDLRATAALCEDQYLTFNFGIHGAATISRGAIINVIPETKLQGDD